MSVDVSNLRPPARTDTSSWLGEGLSVRPAVRSRFEHLQPTVTALLLLGSIVAAALAQGGFFARGQLAIAALIAAVAITAMPLTPVRENGLRLSLVAAGLLGAWVVLRSFLAGSLPAGAGGAILLIEVTTVIVVCRGLDRP